MNLATRYLGLDLPHPLMAGAGPLADDLDAVRRLEDAGSAAIVLRSLFEEQLTGEQLAVHHHTGTVAEAHPEASGYFADPPDFALGPVEYLDHLHRVRQAIDLPVIASLNGTTSGGWLEFARMLASAGASALELNVYDVPVDPTVSATTIEHETVEMVRTLSHHVQIPIAIKLSPYYTALSHFATTVAAAGAHGLILFNRFYQADIDPEALEVVPHLRLSDSSELLVRLHWIALLSGRVNASLAVTGGIHTTLDAVRAIMAGADAVQMVSALLKRGPGFLTTMRGALAAWLEEHEYESLAQMRGSMNVTRTPDPDAYRRLNYMRVLHSWRGFGR